VSVISTLSILLTADSASLRAELRRSQRQLSAWGSEARSGLKSVSVAFSGSAVAAGAAVSVMVAHSLEAARATDQMAGKLGVASESLAGFQYAAAQFNVDGEQAADVLEQLNIRISEYANIGTGEAADFFEVTKLSAKDFAALRPDEQILKVASALESMPRNTQVMFLDQLTGGEGVKMIEMLDNGAEGLKEMSAEAAALGVALSDIEIAQLAETDRALSRTGAAFAGIGNQMAIGLSPYIQAVADQFVDFARHSDGFKDPIINSIKSVARSVAFLGDTWHGLKVVAKGVEVAISGIMAGVITGLDETNKFFLNMLKSMVSVAVSALAAPFEMLAPVSDTAADIAKSIRGVGDSAEALFAPAKSLSNLASAAREATSGLASEMQSLAMETTMGQSVEQFISDVEAQALGAATAIAKQREEIRSSPTDAQAPVGIVDQQKAAQLQADIQAIRESAMTELELLDFKHEQELGKVWGYVESRAILEEEGMSILESLDQQHQDRRTAIERKGFSDREKFEQMSYKNKTKMVLGEMGSLLSGVAQQNKTLFKINQAAAISTAVVNAYQGASKSLAQYPMPLAAVMAAAHVASGLAQVAKIRSTSFGSGGGSASVSSVSPPSGMASVAVPSSTPSLPDPRKSDADQEQRPQNVIQFIGDWSGVSRDSIDQVMEGITEKINDGGAVLFGPGSEQAAALKS